MQENGKDIGGFFKAGQGIGALEDAEQTEPKPILERLGPAPFRSKGFPLLGFLATLYEHVAESVQQQPGSGRRDETGNDARPAQ